MTPRFVIGLLALALAACGGSAAGHSAAPPSTRTLTHTLTGSVVIGQVVDIQNVINGVTQVDLPTTTCQGSGGFSDLAPGASVTVRGPSGSVLAVGRIDAGQYVDVQDTGPMDVPNETYELRSGFCALTFSVAGVPAASSYSVKLGDGSRPPISYSATELAAMGWHLTLTVGSVPPIAVSQAANLG